MASALLLAALTMHRDILVVKRGRVERPSEIRELAQCATASLLLRSGMRENTRLWLSLPDRRGLTLSVDGALAQLTPVMGKTIKAILQTDLASGEALDALALPPGWAVHTDESLLQRLESLGCRARTRREKSQDQTLLQGRLRALRARTEPLEIAPSSTPLDPTALDPAARDEMLLARRLDAMRVKSKGVGQADAAQADEDVVEAAEPHSRLVVLDGLGAGPRLTAEWLDDGNLGGNTPTVVLLTADGGGFTDAEEEGIDSVGGKLVSVGALPLLANHYIVLAHAVLDST